MDITLVINAIKKYCICWYILLASHTDFNMTVSS